MQTDKDFIPTESNGRFMWRIIYPLLIYIGVELIVEFVFVFFIFGAKIMGGEYDSYINAITAATSSTDAFSVAYEDFMTKVMNDTQAFVSQYGQYIAGIRYIICIPLMILFFRKDIALDKVYKRHKEYGPYNKAWLAIVPVAAFAAALGFNNLIELTGLTRVSESYQEVATTTYSAHPVVIFLASGVLAPITEELLFRGLIYKRLRNRFGIIASMIFGSLLFGIVHGNLVQFIYAFLLGSIFSYIYEKFKTIIAPIIAHAGANIIAVAVTLYMPKIEAPIGTVMLVAVVELAITFVALKLVDRFVNRREIVTPTYEQEN